MPPLNFSALLAVVDFSTIRNAILAVFAVLIFLALNYKSIMQVLAFVRSENERKQLEQEFQKRFEKEERSRLAKERRAERNRQYNDWKTSRMGPRPMPKGRWRGLDW
ncbi:hypothetical protein [Azovibrio restrictus]|uniref:hypothetical protein n=1 Tax=Azovibrio restrictus TaxID=146938 RepID=UPI0026EFC495|nr:hypothetical protein [Azovibrio restrictus]MDD3483150.1 hypothetical protein [Azovibrio restrictus]